MMGQPTQLSGSRYISPPLRLGQWGLMHLGKLPASLLIIIHQDLAPRASRRVSAFLEQLMPAVHQ
jgi:hypothetical protein